MREDYTAFLERKMQLDGEFGFDPYDVPDALFDFQRALVTWATRKGRAAIYAALRFPCQYLDHPNESVRL